MSDYSDVLYDPRSHTHDSCLKEVPGCDMVVLIIGSRFGGLAVPSAFENVNLAAMQLSTKSGVLETKEKLSITQLEVLKAVEQSIPVYAFVDEKVLNDHHVYERNKDKKDVIDQIEFPSIQKRDTAKYIFEFINFLSHRATNNSITGFSRLEEIRLHLASQWSQLFQRLLMEGRTKTQEARRDRDLSESFEDLKAIVLTSLAMPDLRDTAKERSSSGMSLPGGTNAESQAFCAGYEIYAVLCDAVTNATGTTHGINHRLSLLQVQTRLTTVDFVIRNVDAGAAVQRAISAILAELKAGHSLSVAAHFALPGNALLTVARKPIGDIGALADAAGRLTFTTENSRTWDAIRTAWERNELTDQQMEDVVKSWINDLYLNHRPLAVQGSGAPSILDAIEITPGAFGVSIDVKQFVQRLVASMRGKTGAS